MNIFQTLFRQGPAAQPNPQSPDPMNPGNPNIPANVAMLNAQPLPNPQAPVIPAVVEKPPEVDYSKLWDIDPKAQQPANLAEFSFNIDPAKVGQTFGQLDFAKSVTPEIMAKIAAGGPEAVSAMMTAMNTIGQEAVKTAVLASTRVTENGIRSNGQRLQDTLPNLVRNHTVSSALREDNPLMKDPAFAPIVATITEQITRQFPQATAEEIKAHSKAYFDRFATTAAGFAGKTISETPVAPGANTRAMQLDWSNEPT